LQSNRDNYSTRWVLTDSRRAYDKASNP
jgi:hypothetical protein